MKFVYQSACFEILEKTKTQFTGNISEFSIRITQRRKGISLQSSDISIFFINHCWN